MKIYLAGRFVNKELLKAKRSDLEKLGHFITSRWLDGQPYSKQDNALMDLEDIDKADAIVLYADTVPQPERPYGGMFVEFGYGFAKKKKIFVVHPELTRCIFIHLPEVIHLPTWEALYEYSS